MASLEALVILSREGADDARSHLRAHHRITQEVSPRVVVIERPEQPEALRSRPGVLAVATGAAPPEAVATLDAVEALFADAWAERARPKGRPGDGRAWDAPGFTPPDPPPGPSD